MDDASKHGAPAASATLRPEPPDFPKVSRLAGRFLPFFPRTVAFGIRGLFFCAHEARSFIFHVFKQAKISNVTAKLDVRVLHG